MASEGLGEMFEGDSADMCAGKFPPVSMGGQAEDVACADLGARTPSALAEISLPFNENKRTIQELSVYISHISLYEYI